MANRLRTFFESIVYAGMKPGGRSTGDASDPLYLSNQSLGQKARRMLRWAVPLAVLIAVGVGAIAVFGPKHHAAGELTPAEIAAKSLPAFNRDLNLPTNHDVEVTEVHFEHTPANLMVGNLRNLTNHELAHCVVVFDLTDENRSQIGAVTVTQTNLAPGSVREFKLPIEQTNAVLAVVRETHAQ